MAIPASSPPNAICNFLRTCITFYLIFRAFLHLFYLLYYFFLNINLFIFFYLFLAELCLCYCVWAFSSCSKRGLLFVVVCGLLIAVASLVAEPWL